jgi:hypothetical protein
MQLTILWYALLTFLSGFANSAASNLVVVQAARRLV